MLAASNGFIFPLSPVIHDIKGCAAVPRRKEARFQNPKPPPCGLDFRFASNSFPIEPMIRLGHDRLPQCVYQMRKKGRGVRKTKKHKEAIAAQAKGG